MEYLQHNLAALRRRDPLLADLMAEGVPPGEFTLETARNGERTVKRNGICLHSVYNPSREAAEWAETVTATTDRPLTLFGFGLGYHLRELAARNHGGCVIEPDPALFRLALEQIDLTAVLERFRPLVGLPAETVQRAHRDELAGEISIHPASLRSRPDYFAPLAAYARGVADARKGGLRLLLVNPVSGGSLPAARHCAAALERMGHEVSIYGSEAFAQGRNFAALFRRPEHGKHFLDGMDSLLSQGVELRAEEFQPDLVLALAQAPLHPATLCRLKEMGIPTAFWFVEDYRVLPYWRDVARHYGYFFTMQKGEFSAELAREGVERHAYLPAAASPQLHTTVELSSAEREEFGSPLSFVGAGYHNRQRFFRGLADYPLKIWGSGWPMTAPLVRLIQRQSAWIDTETCTKIFNATQINLNLHSSSHLDGVDPFGDFVNPRTFELACSGAFQLVDRRSLMTELFRADELETFTTLEELRQKIDHYRSAPEERQAFACRGRARVRAEHTYEARMEELLAHMLCSFPSIGQRRAERRLDDYSLHDTMTRLPGVADILQRLPAGAAANLQQICAAIAGGEGTLSRAERLFLMLRNIETTGGDEA